MKNQSFKCFIAIVLSLVMVSACSDKEDFATENKGNTTFTQNESAKVVDEEVTRYFMEVNADYIKITSSAPTECVPQKGEIICCSITEKTPYGFLGRVKDITKTVDEYYIQTESVSLEEAFEELSINEETNLTACIDSIFDESGNPVRFEYVSDSVWDTLSNDSTDATTKSAQSRLSAENTARISIGNEYIEGGIFIQIDHLFKIEIDDWKLNHADIRINPIIGCDASINIALVDKSFSLFKKSYTVHLKPTMIGNVVIHPVLKIEVAADVSGKVDINSAISYTFMNSEYQISYIDGKWHSKSLNRSSGVPAFNIAEMDMNGEISLGLKSELKVGVYIENIGISFEAEGKFGLSSSFTREEENLLEENPIVKAVPEVSGKMGLFAEFIGLDFQAESAALVVPFKGIEWNLLPEILDLDTKAENKRIQSHSIWNGRSFLPTTYGLALFDDKEMKEVLDSTELAHNYFLERKNKESEFDTTFPISSQGVYYVAPYSKFMKKIWYGKPKKVTNGKRLKKVIEVGNPVATIYNYDEKGQLTSLSVDNFTHVADRSIGNIHLREKPFDDDQIYKAHITLDSLAVDTLITDPSDPLAVDTLYAELITSVTDENYNRIYFSYDNGHLVKAAGYTNATWTWENGNITRYTFQEGDYTSSYTCTYYTDLICKNPVYAIDALELRIAAGSLECSDDFLMAHPELIGKSNRNLLKTRTDEDGVTYSYAYKLDDDGYPIEMTITDESDGYENEIIQFVWE